MIVKTERDTATAASPETAVDLSEALGGSDRDEAEPAKVETEKVFHFIPSPPERPSQRKPVAGGRDWSAAIDLINEASEAVRLAEERTVSAEQYSEKLTQFYKEQLKVVEGKLAAAERRADAAELRASEAEEWLARLHDAIVTGFRGALESR